MTDTTADVVIIGGGLIGTSIAYYLMQAGMTNVTIIEKEFVGAGATGKSAGGFRQQFSTPVNIQMSRFSVNVFENINAELGTEIVFHQPGYLFVASTKEHFNLFHANVQLQQSYGVEVDLLTPEQIQGLVPEIYIDDVYGGTFCHRDGYSDPYELAQGFAKACRKKNVTVFEQTTVQDLETSGGKIEAVITDKGKITTRIVVNAAGAYSPVIAKMAGIDIPVKPYRRQIYVSAPFPAINRKLPMIIDFKSGVYMRTEGQSILLGLADKDEPASYNTNVDWRFLEKIVGPAVHRVPLLENLEIQDGWAGLYDTTPDHHAILGFVQEIDGLILATGFSGHGFMHSPAVGKCISELIIEGASHTIDITPLSIERFRTQNLLVEKNVI